MKHPVGHVRLFWDPQRRIAFGAIAWRRGASDRFPNVDISIGGLLHRLSLADGFSIDDPDFIAFGFDARLSFACRLSDHEADADPAVDLRLDGRTLDLADLIRVRRIDGAGGAAFPGAEATALFAAASDLSARNQEASAVSLFLAVHFIDPTAARDLDLARFCESARRRGCFLAPVVLRDRAPRRLAEGEMSAEYGVCISYLARSYGYGETAWRILQTELALNGESAWTLAALGHCAFSNADRTQADALYCSAAQVAHARGQRLIHFDNGVMSWRPEAFCDAIFSASADPSFSDLFPRVEVDARSNALTRPFIHVVGCDDGYWRRFGEALIRTSLAVGGDEVGVHVHVLNPSEETFEAMAAIAKVTPALTFSQHRAPAERLDVGYYTVLRFLAARSLVIDYGRDVVSTDIDILLTSAWPDARRALAETSIGLRIPGGVRADGRLGRTGDLPWSLAAGSVYFAADDHGRRFCANVFAYLSRVYCPADDGRRPRNWVIDQVALRQAIEFESRHGLSPRERLADLTPLITYTDPSSFEGGKDAFEAAFRTAAGAATH